LRSEHLVAIEAEQENPHGPELEPIDPSFVGREVKINTTISTKEKQIEAKRMLDKEFNES